MHLSCLLVIAHLSTGLSFPQSEDDSVASRGIIGNPFANQVVTETVKTSGKELTVNTKESEEKNGKVTATNDNWKTTCNKPCSGEDCKRVQEKITNLLDMTVDPCEDFFRFSCKEQTRGVAPLPKRPEPVTFLDLVQNPPSKEFRCIKDFYDSCTGITEKYTTEAVVSLCLKDGSCDENELATFGWNYVEFLHYIKQFADETKWPAVTPGDWDEITEDWYKVGWTWWEFSAQILNRSYFLGAFQYISRGSDHFLSNVFFAPMIDKTLNKSREAEGDLSSKIHIVPMTIDRGFVSDKNKMVKYKKLMRMLIGYLGKNQDSLDKDVNTIMELEAQLAEISQSKYSLNQDWEEIRIQKLYELVPYVDWLDYINLSLNSSNISVRSSDKVMIPSQDIMVSIGNWVDSLTRRDQANLITWTIFSDFASNFMHTGKENITGLQENIFYDIHDLKPEDKNRSRNCLIQIQTFFPTVERDMFIKKYLSQQEIDDIDKMFKSLKDEFGVMIENNNWMGKRTAKAALRKLEDIDLIIGEITTRTQNLDELKKVISSTDYIGNIVNIGNYHWKRNVESLKKDKEVFSQNERRNNAFYYHRYNAVVIKTGLINGMLDLGFSLNLPRSLIYGAFVASTLGHELVHGFDSRGRDYGPQGVRYNWWEKQSYEAYGAKEWKCRDQYSDFPIHFEGRSYKTRGYRQEENIADNGGVKLAFRTYNKTKGGADDTCLPSLPFSPAQLFWVGYAMDWCLFQDNYVKYRHIEDLLTSQTDQAGHVPAPWRVNVVLSNIPEFAQDFNCTVKDKYEKYPKDVCEIW